MVDEFADGRRGAADAPGLHAARPRDDRPDGGGCCSRLPRPAELEAASAAVAVRRVVAADQVGVRAAGAGDPLGQELERRRGSEQGGDRRRQVRRLVDDQPAGRRQLGGELPRRRRGRRSPPPGARRPAPPRAPGAPARSALGAPVAVGEDQDEAGRRVRRGQVPVEERLEVAHRRRHPGRLLDLQRELAGGRPVGAGGDGQDRPAAGRGRRRSPRRPPRRRRPAARRSRTTAGSTSMPDSSRADRGRGDDRRQVADRVAPALVHLDGLDDELSARRPAGRRSGAAGDQRRPARRGRRRPRAPGSSPPSRPRARCRSRARRSAGRGRARTPGPTMIDAGPTGRPAARIASRRISTTAWAACSLVPQPVTTIGAPLLAAWPIAPASRPAGPADRPAGRGGARPRTARRAIMSVMWYGGPDRVEGAAARPRGRARGRGARADRSSSSAEDTARDAGRKAPIPRTGEGVQAGMQVSGLT